MPLRVVPLLFPPSLCVILPIMSRPVSPRLDVVPTNLPTEHSIVPDLLPGSYKIHAIAAAQLYHAKLHSGAWAYYGSAGSVVFGRNDAGFDSQANIGNQSEPGCYWFRLIKADKTVFLFKLPADFVYHADRPFFHVFRGMVRLRFLAIDCNIKVFFSES